MTGRDLILYILSNGLEDEEVFKDGKILGFLTVGEVAVKLDVGTATVRTWLEHGRIQGYEAGYSTYIPANFKVEGLDGR